MRYKEFVLFESKRRVLDEATVADMNKAYSTVFDGYKPLRKPITFRNHFFQRLGERMKLSQDQLYDFFATIKNKDLVTKAFPNAQTYDGYTQNPTRNPPTVLIKIKYEYAQPGGNKETNLAEILVKYYQNNILFDTLFIQTDTAAETRFGVPAYEYKGVIDLSNSDASDTYGQSASEISRTIHGIESDLKPIVGHVSMPVTDVIQQGIDQVLLGRNMEITKINNALPRNKKFHQDNVNDYNKILDNIVVRGTTGKILSSPKDRVLPNYFDPVKIDVLPWNNNNKIATGMFMKAFPKLFANMQNQYDIDDSGILRLKQRDNIINRQNTAVQKYQSPEYYREISEKSLNSIQAILKKAEESMYDFDSLDDFDNTTGGRLEKIISDIQNNKESIINNVNGVQTNLLNQISNIVNSYDGNTDQQKSTLFSGIGRKIGALKTYNSGQFGLDAYARYLAAANKGN